MTEGTQLDQSNFTEAMHQQARAEGWRLSERSDGYLGIEREDEAERFKTDDDAHEFVADQARLHGSYMHQLALHLDGTLYRTAANGTEFNVHLYVCVRVKIDGIRAKGHEAAAEIAVAAFHPEMLKYGEYAEQIHSALVDVVGDDEHIQTREINLSAVANSSAPTSEIERDTILAALRFWQRKGNSSDLPEYVIFQNGDDDRGPMDDHDIDALCERINV